MKAIVSLLQAAAVVAGIEVSHLFPTASPTKNDPWYCATENITSYFDVPKPTAALKTALDSYGAELYKACTLPLEERLDCPYPAYSSWCGFATAAAPEVTAYYSSYASEASSWWFRRSSTAQEIASVCPNRWRSAMEGLPFGGVWLNQTIAFARCYDEAHPNPNPEPSTTEVSPLTSTMSSASSGARETRAAESGTARRRGDGSIEMIVAAAAAAATVGMIL
ncbi:Uncharacterized protein TPAR_06378 [Tolypocladium paradoxum]|uniref:DUF7735 domain-containing protein n=1 Tax=Tolypocladium paradoxum TaxID=94208 RepID=A0A2S4KTC9_9HYPO|nr:Uncharacterized protein TPAR_06378 [Tolypocladium paradoxum]